MYSECPNFRAKGCIKDGELSPHKVKYMGNCIFNLQRLPEIEQKRPTREMMFSAEETALMAANATLDLAIFAYTF
jgi:hypothetical protein